MGVSILLISHPRPMAGNPNWGRRLRNPKCRIQNPLQNAQSGITPCCRKSSSPPFHLHLLHSSPPRVGPILKWGLKSSISFPPPPSPLLPTNGGSYPKNSEFTKTRKSRTANASLSKAHWEMLVRKVRSSKARRGEPKTKSPGPPYCRKF